MTVNAGPWVTMSGNKLEKDLNKGRVVEAKFRGKNNKYYRSLPQRVRFSEIDQYGVLWNGHYIQYFESARLELCEFFKFNLGSLANAGIALPIHNIEIEIKAPIQRDDTFHIYVRPKRFESGMIDFFHFIKSEDGKLLATSKVRHILYDMEKNEIIKVLNAKTKEVIYPMLKEFLSEKEIN